QMQEHVAHAAIFHRTDMAHIVAPGGFDLDHAGAKVAENLGGVGAHDHRGQIDHGESGQRTAHRLRSFGGITHPLARSDSSTQLRSTLPLPRMALSIAASFLAWSRASAMVSAANACGSTSRPSSSPMMMSPGLTTASPMTTGTLISPGPFLYGP